ncbi:MAG: ABC transporter substrate-binding protein [Spirochaetia bacterium]|jgi:branched-chain amino acid transport system substrate-binding protein|uniref:Branched-chain amino acid ABC transporter substrate-binding protein n=1 Tax=uncultured spirochete TaxID=156406 RepID=A0A3P3XJZ7_9SPIR|nr:ABC transporter substrate-binding protein [Spirochaetia bacterium]SLM14312.1 Branched-chain amino acid ABC transporter substrate-binding protein [uncultured spirochete]HCX96714.1 ethanolamine utilization protein EutJ [Spirochaetaceae bacterium]
MKKVLFVMALVVLVAASYAQDIKIGGIGPVTGEAATFGISTKNGMTMAVDEWNAKGGIFGGRKAKLIFEDDKGDPSEGAIVWNKLIQQDNVVAIVGTVMSKVSLVGAPISQAAGIPMISPTSTNEKVTLVGDYIFRACFIDPFQGTVGANFAYNDLKARSAAAIFDLGNDYTKGLAENFKKQFEKLGGKIVAFEGHPTGTTDFKAQLTKILQGKPDVIYIPDYYNDVGLIAKQARELGFKGPLVGGDGWDSPELVKIGGTAVENGFFTNHYSSEDKRAIVQDFVKKYKAKFGAEPDALAALGYDAMYIMLDAIKRAGSTKGAAIRDALKATDINVVSGRIKFDENRNPIKSAVIIEIKNGKQVYRTTVNP